MSRRLWMSTLNITALTALLVTLAVYLYVQPRFQARPTSYSQTILEDNEVEELVKSRPWLVVHKLNPSPVFSDNQQRLAIDAQQVEMELPKDEGKRIQAILTSLKNRMSISTVCANSTTPCVENHWPDALGVPEIFQSNLGNSQSTTILNFPLQADVEITVQQEEALKASITETLSRNNINNSLWLINDEPRPIFIRHIALKNDLQ